MEEKETKNEEVLEDTKEMKNDINEIQKDIVKLIDNIFFCLLSFSYS